MNHISKLVIGTVQFGLDYGINNTHGQVPEDEVLKILSLAQRYDIGILDTSYAYGTSEKVLGNILHNRNFDFKIVSKYPQTNEDIPTIFARSLKALQQSHLYAYLLHHFESYFSNHDIWKDMIRLKAEGKVEKIGFSIYTTEQLQYLLDQKVPFDIIQFPYNIFDRQFDSYLPKLKQMGVEIHTRSAFLQGLFFKNTETLSPQLMPLKKYLLQMNSFCKQHHITIESCALNFVLQNPYIDGVLIGIDNVEQLQKNINAAQHTECINELSELSKQLIIKEKHLLNPSNWK